MSVTRSGVKSEQVFRGLFDGGDVKNHTLVRGHLNGLVIYQAAQPENSRVTIKRRTKSGVVVLASNLKLNHIRRVSAAEYGYDYKASWYAEKLARELVAKDPTTFPQTWLDGIISTFGRQGLVMSYLNLGSLYLGGDSELEVTVNFDPTMGQDVEHAFYAVSVDRAPDFMLQYDVTSDLEATHKGVDAVYLLGKSGPLLATDAITPPDISVHIEDDEGAYLTDFLGAYSVTNIFENIESAASSDLLTVFRKRDAVPADVFVKIAGADASAVDVLVRRVRMDQQSVSVNTVEELTKLRARVGELERKQPELAKALRHAGEVAKAEELAKVEAAAQASNASDGAR